MAEISQACKDEKENYFMLPLYKANTKINIEVVNHFDVANTLQDWFRTKSSTNCSRKLSPGFASEVE